MHVKLVQHNFLDSHALTGAPVNPRSGTLPSNFFRVNLMASKTYCSDLKAPDKFSLSRSAGSFSGSGKTGP